MGCFSTRATALRIAQLCRIYRCLLSVPSPWTARSRKNSLLENKGIAVGLSFPPHKDVEVVGGAELSEVWCVFLGLVFVFFLSCRNLRRSWCKHLCQPSGTGRFHLQPCLLGAAVPPALEPSAVGYLQNPALPWRKRCQQLNGRCLQHRLGQGRSWERRHRELSTFSREAAVLF